MSNASQAGLTPTSQDKVRAASIRRSLLPRGVSAGPLTSERLFLNVDDEFGVPQAHREPLVLLAELCILQKQRIPAFFLAAPLLGPQGAKGACVPLASPGGEVRGVKPLPPQKGPETSRLGAGVGERQDAKLVFRRKPPPGGLRRNLGIGRGCWGSPMQIALAWGFAPGKRGGPGSDTGFPGGVVF